MHYFQIEDIMKLDLEQNIYLETEIKDIIKLNIELFRNLNTSGCISW